MGFVWGSVCLPAVVVCNAKTDFALPPPRTTLANTHTHKTKSESLVLFFFLSGSGGSFWLFGRDLTQRKYHKYAHTHTKSERNLCEEEIELRVTSVLVCRFFLSLGGVGFVLFYFCVRLTSCTFALFEWVCSDGGGAVMIFFLDLMQITFCTGIAGEEKR